jgi:hypothetical protein
MHWEHCRPAAYENALNNPDQRIREWIEKTWYYGKSLNPILVKNAFIQDQKKKAAAVRHWIRTIRSVRRDNEQIGDMEATLCHRLELLNELCSDDDIVIVVDLFI